MHISSKPRILAAALVLAGSTAIVTTLALPPALAAQNAAPLRVDMTVPDFSALVEQNAAAVVNVTVTSKKSVATVPRGFAELDDDSSPPLPPFFRQFPMPPGGPGGQSIPAQGMGSGFIIDTSGYIVTNHHVIDGAEQIRVRLSDRREFAATVVGSDPQSDIALLKIDAHDLPTVTLGDARNLKVGQWVFAIGAPFGLERTATKGIVSALGRALPNDTYVPFIQTDVPINPGNSGGPLFDLSGRVVGINSQIFSRSGGYMGLSFAIPADVAMDVITQLKADGHVTRGWLGIGLQEVTADLARSFNLEQPRGALVADVSTNGPAAKAGLQAGDIIGGYAGRVIGDSTELPPLVGSSRPGARKDLTIIRDGREQTLEVTLGTLSDRKTPTLALNEPPADNAPRLNVAVTDVPASPDHPESSGGVRVEQLAPGPAAKAGVKPGDILVSLNRQPIRDVAHLQQLVRELPRGTRVPLLVKRAQGSLYLAVEIPAA